MVGFDGVEFHTKPPINASIVNQRFLWLSKNFELA